MGQAARRPGEDHRRTQDSRIRQGHGALLPGFEGRRAARRPKLWAFKMRSGSRRRSGSRWPFHSARPWTSAGFRDVKIHMHNPPTLAEGVAAARAFRATDASWKAIDYAASNVYDYQNFFYDPDGFDARVREMKEVIGSKPFLASELCVNNSAFQTRTYRTAFAMGQLYHKLLTALDACGAMYCWTSAQRHSAILRLDPHSDGAGRRARVCARGIQPSTACLRRLLSPRSGRHDPRPDVAVRIRICW